MIKFSRNITDVTFSSKSGNSLTYNRLFKFKILKYAFYEAEINFKQTKAEFIQADVATSTVVFTSTPWNARQTGKMFAFLIGVEQPWGTDILSQGSYSD